MLVSFRYFYMIGIFLFFISVLLCIGIYKAYYRVPLVQDMLIMDYKNKDNKQTFFNPPVINFPHKKNYNKEAILKKSLFSPQRTKVEEPEHPQDNSNIQVFEKSYFKVMGIMIAGDKKRVLLKNEHFSKYNKSLKWFEEEESFWGISIEKIEKEAVTVRTKGGKIVILNIYELNINQSSDNPVIKKSFLGPELRDTDLLLPEKLMKNKSIIHPVRPAIPFQKRTK